MKYLSRLIPQDTDVLALGPDELAGVLLEVLTRSPVPRSNIFIASNSSAHPILCTIIRRGMEMRFCLG